MGAADLEIGLPARAASGVPAHNRAGTETGLELQHIDGPLLGPSGGLTRAAAQEDGLSLAYDATITKAVADVLSPSGRLSGRRRDEGTSQHAGLLLIRR